MNLMNVEAYAFFHNYSYRLYEAIVPQKHVGMFNHLASGFQYL